MSGDVTVSGPLFDGRADIALNHACEASARTIATIGASMVRTQMNTVFRTQTPYARTLVEAVPEAPGWKIWHQNLIYGPWLEGVGSRNRTTRFKGYFSFRITAGRLQARANALCERVIVSYQARWM